MTQILTERNAWICVEISGSRLNKHAFLNVNKCLVNCNNLFLVFLHLFHDTELK